MAIDSLILLYLLVMLAIICGTGWWADRHRRRFEPGPTDDQVFRCRRCGGVYTDDPDVDLSRCPQCGRNNQPFHF